VLIGAAAAAAQVHAARVASAERAETHALAHRLDAIAASLQSLDANRPDLAGLKKSLADLKANAASAHELGGAVAQLNSRVDRLEKDQTSRLDKLDKDSGQQLASIAQRLEKLEVKTTAPAAPKPEPAKAAPAISMETTGSIEKARAPLRDLYLSQIHNGYAMIESPQGEFAVGPGDMVPGGGRVLRIERHGHEWVVVTTLGQIASAGD
jgi:TolA-binding protein